MFNSEPRGFSPADATANFRMRHHSGTPQSLPKFEHPSHSMLKENGFAQHVYSKYHSKCLRGENEIIKTYLFISLEANNRLLK